MYKEILKLERNTRTLIKNDTNYIYNLFLENNKQIPLKEKDYLAKDNILFIAIYGLRDGDIDYFPEPKEK